MPTRKSNNSYYGSDDLKRPFDNIKEAMGLTGNADSNYLTNLGKVSRWEGTEMDNRKKQGLWEALQLANQGKTPDEAFARHSGVSATDLLKLFTGEKEQPFRVEQQEHKARQEGQKVEQGDLGLKLATMIANLGGGTEDPRPEGYEREAFPWEGGQGDPALQGDVLENVMQRFAAINPGKEHKVTSDPLGRKGERITKGKVGVLTARENLLKAQKEGYENLNVKQVNQVLAATDKIIAQTKVLEGVGTERINQIRQKVLDDVNKNLESVRNLKDMNKLINERILIAAEKLKGEGFKTDTAKLEAGAKGGELYLNKRQLEVKLETLKQKLLKETDNAKIAALNQQYAKTLKKYEVEIGKQKTATATSQADKSESTANIAAQNEKVNPQRLKDLQTTRTNIIERGKVALKKAGTDSDKADIKLRIEKELEPVEIAIRKMSLTNAEATLQNKEANTYKTMVTTPNPGDLKRKRQNLEARTDASKRSGSGGGTSTDDLINQLTGEEKTPTTRGVSSPASKKGLPPDPAATAIFDNLMSVKPEVLKTWTPEEIDSAVAMALQQFPNMTDVRIRRLIQTAQKRSQ
jgi:hypothetical protein